MATDYQALLNAQQNPWLAYLQNQGYSPADLASLTPAAGPTQLTPDQIDSIYGQGYSTQPLYHEAFPGYDGSLQSAIQYTDAQMNANKNAGLTNLGLALAGGITGGLLSGAGAAGGVASDAQSFTGAPLQAVADSPATFLGGASDLVPGGGVLASGGTVGQATLASAGLPAGLGGASTTFAGSALGPVLPGAASSGLLGSSLYGPAPYTAGGAASSAFSGGVDPNAAPNLADPGAQTPGGYDLANGSQIPNLPGANMASSLPSWLQSLLPYSGLIGAGLGLVDSALQPDSKTTTQGGTSQSTNSSTLQLPSQLTGGASDALTRANQLLGQGQQFAPTPYLLNHTADQLNNLGSNTAPTTSSFASGANINPYLDMTFNAAADSTQNRLGTEFANAGQVNSPQHQGDRSQELQTLAAGIYGPGYQQAQNLQYGAQEAGVSRGLQQQDSNLNRTLQGAQTALPIAQYMQQQQQAQLNGPQTSLNQYIGQLGGLAPYFPGTATQTQGTTQTGNVTQPLYNNPLTSAIGGAALGSYYGNMLGGQPQQQGQQYAQTPVNRQQAQDFSPVTYDQTGMPSVNYLGGNLAGINNLYSGIGTQQPLNAGFGGLNYGAYAY
jgi:hypothetical protein